ncbi:MAG: hypothetical protein AAFN93_15805 [Bacteroidota bacterium]
MRKIIALLLGLASFSAYAQPDFENGFIVMNNQDTLKGTVRDRTEGVFPKLYKKVRFKASGKKKARKYSADQIKGYSKGGQLFESVMKKDLDDELLGLQLTDSKSYDRVFLKVVLRGPASYYQLEWLDQDAQQIDRADYIKKENSPTFVRSTQGIFGLKKKKLAAYFDDCPDLQQKIRNKEMTSSMEVVKFYNDWMSKYDL